MDEGLNMLLFMVKSVKPKEILEIGTAVGLSGVAMLNACEAKLTTVEKDKLSIEEAKNNFKLFNVENRVTLIEGDAAVEIKILEKKFDFIFLDGAKSQYKNYLETLIGLLNKGGILFADNVLFRSYVAEENEVPKKYKSIANNLKIFLEMLKNESRLETVVLNIGDGISISVRRD
jgi:predicted O-methyltransferase YrrM